MLEWRGLSTRGPLEVEAEFYAQTTAAETARVAETAAATRLASAWRGNRVRVRISNWNQKALVIERITRGYLHRLHAADKQRERNLARQRSFFETHATTIQLRYRGFYSRKYKHSFYARKAYIAAVVRKGGVVRTQLQQRFEQQVNEYAEREEVKAREKVSSLSAKLHHLRSTATCSSIYNSPYHAGYHPTAFGIPVEEHLRTAIRPLIKQELAQRSKSLKPIHPLPPIKPQSSPIAFAAVEAEKKEQTWLEKNTRYGSDDFRRAVGQGQIGSSYQGSVHVGVGYHPPLQSIQRSVDKTKWIGQDGDTFYPAVPSNRTVSSAGSGRVKL